MSLIAAAMDTYARAHARTFTGREVALDAATAALRTTQLDGVTVTWSPVNQEIRPVDSAAYNIYREGPQHALYDEMAWFALSDNVLGALIRDRIDNDYSGIVLTPDDDGQYRLVDCVHSLPTPDEAAARLYVAMRAAAAQNQRPDPL
jgi:hypothetical protein